MKGKTFQVKILDFSYEDDFLRLNFRYLTYEVKAQDKEKALKMARALYMKGETAILSEELPFLIKLFTVNDNL